MVVFVGEDSQLVFMVSHAFLFYEDDEYGGAGIGGIGAYAREVATELWRVTEDCGCGIEERLVGGLGGSSHVKGAGVASSEKCNHIGENLIEIGLTAGFDVAGESFGESRASLQRIPSHRFERISLGRGLSSRCY
jgi:hypothetical protein